MQKMNIGLTIDGSTITLTFPEEMATVIRSFTCLDKSPVDLSASHELSRSEKVVVTEKRPKGHAETVAVLAFCLKESGTIEFSPEEMRRAYIRAGMRPPKVVAQALRDAKNKYELIEVGSRKGKF